MVLPLQFAGYFICGGQFQNHILIRQKLFKKMEAHDLVKVFLENH
jgi:hypothetical protein